MDDKELEKLTTAILSWEEGISHLGHCIVEFQRIEKVLASCITGLAGAEQDIGKILTSEMSYRAKVSIYRSLFFYRWSNDELPEDITQLIGRLHWAEQERNTLVHSLWDASEEHPEYIKRGKTVCRKSGLNTQEEYYTPEDLDELSRLYEGISTDLIYLTELHLKDVEIHFT